MAGSAEEPAKLFNGNVFQPCALAGRSIRRSCAKEALAFQVFDQAGIYGRRQIGNTDKAPPDKLAARGTDKFQHFRMSSFVIGALVGSGQVLESKRVEIAAQQRVASDEVGQGATLSSEFLLDGADENVG